MVAVICGIFFVGILLLGILAGRKLKSANEWAGGGKDLNWFTAGMLIVTFQIGGTSIIGSAQYGYTMGMAGVWYSLAGFVAIAASALFTRSLRKHVSDNTLTNFLERRYSPKVGGIYSTVYLVMGFIYIPIQLFTLTTILRTAIPGLSFNWSCVIGLLLSISYIVVSGIKGAGLVSKISGILMYLAITAGVVMTMTRTGGFAALHAALPAAYFSIFTMPAATWISWFITIFVAFLTMQAAIQPTLSCRDDRQARGGILFGALLNLPIGFLCAWIGMVGRNNLDLENSSLAFATTVSTFVPPALTGVIFAAIALIIVCTLAGQMLAVGTIIQKVLTPVYEKKNLDDRKRLMSARLITFLYAFLTIIPTFLVQQAMLSQLVTILIACATGPMFFSIVAGMYWKRMNAAAAAWSILSGLVVGVLWCLLGDPNAVQPVYLILPVSAAVGCIAALAAKPRPLSV